MSVLTSHAVSAGPGASLVPCLRTATSHMQHTYDFFKPIGLWPQAGNLVSSVQLLPCACRHVHVLCSASVCLVHGFCLSGWPICPRALE